MTKDAIEHGEIPEMGLEVLMGPQAAATVSPSFELARSCSILI
jgi:hypothetical protein